MRITHSVVGVALLGVFLASAVWAEEAPLPQTVSFPQVGLGYDGYLAFISADEPGQPLAAQAEPASACDVACGQACDRCRCSSCCDPCCCGPFRRWQARDPWTLPQPCLLECLGIRTGGWFQGGITMNGEDPADRFNGPLMMNDRHGDPQLHQLWLYFERPCDTGGCGIDVGGRFDIFYGTDWRAALCHGQGLEDRINGFDQLYGLGLPQCYLEVAVNKLSIKMGRMAGILGYEMIPPMGNFFYSHSYTICYTEPLLITGLMGKYPLTDQLDALAGFHQGLHRFEDNNNDLSFQGGLIWTSCDKRTSLAYSLDIGPNDDEGLRDEYLHSLVLKRQLTKNALYVLQNNVGFRNGVAGEEDAEWYSIAQYFIYTFNPCWSAGVRIEWFRDDDGAKIMGIGNLPDARGWLGAPGYEGNFTNLSLGLNWKPKANVYVRPEVRWDWYDGRPNPAGPYALPFDDGNSRRQFTLATDLVVTF